MNFSALFGSTLALILATAPLAVDAQNANQTSDAAPRGSRMHDIVDKLSPQGRLIFEHEWLKGEQQSAPQRHAEYAAAEQNVLAAINAEPFDAGALQRAYANQRNVAYTHQKRKQEHLVSILKRVSPADRRIIADKLRELAAQRAKAYQN